MLAYWRITKHGKIKQKIKKNRCTAYIKWCYSCWPPDRLALSCIIYTRCNNITHTRLRPQNAAEVLINLRGIARLPIATRSNCWIKRRRLGRPNKAVDRLLFTSAPSLQCINCATMYALFSSRNKNIERSMNVQDAPWMLISGHLVVLSFFGRLREADETRPEIQSTKTGERNSEHAVALPPFPTSYVIHHCLSSGW